MKINKILLFDDREYVISTSEHVKRIRESVCKRLRKRKLGIEIEDEKAFYAEEYICYSTDERDEIQKKRTEAEETMEDWLDHLDGLAFDHALVLCDFDWSTSTRGNVFSMIYKQVLNNPAVVFACYSTIRYEEAQDEVDRMCLGEHQCKLMKEVFTSENTPDDFLASLEEAIQHEWDEI